MRMNKRDEEILRIKTIYEVPGKFKVEGGMVSGLPLSNFKESKRKRFTKELLLCIGVVTIGVVIAWALVVSL